VDAGWWRRWLVICSLFVFLPEPVWL